MSLGEDFFVSDFFGIIEDRICLHGPISRANEVFVLSGEVSSFSFTTGRVLRLRRYRVTFWLVEGKEETENRKSGGTCAQAQSRPDGPRAARDSGQVTRARVALAYPQ